jgi:molecular chaperone GrpE
LPRRGTTSNLSSKHHRTAPSAADHDSAETSPEQAALTADIAELEAKLEKMAQDRESLHDQLLRTMADMQNFRRRVESERGQIQLRASEALLRDLLPVLDTFDRTLKAAEVGASAESMAEGIRGVDRQLRSILENRRLTRIAAAGQHFDPALHDAVLVDQVSDQPEGTIVEELEAGYMLGDQVLRPASVKVAKGV